MRMNLPACSPHCPINVHAFVGTEIEDGMLHAILLTSKRQAAELRMPTFKLLG